MRHTVVVENVCDSYRVAVYDEFICEQYHGCHC